MGVVGGIAEYYGVDSTVLRAGTVIVAFLTGIFPLLLAYIVLAAIIPEKPNEPLNHQTH